MKADHYLFAATLAAAAIFCAPLARADSSSDSARMANVAASNTVSSAAEVNAGKPSAAADDSYVLGGGDKIRLSVFGESDLGGEFEIDGSGDVRIPLIGQVKAAGLTVRAFE